ncbi:bifunctional serine/threonine protein kinase/MFS transporter [Candidatus Uabimicrobium amorphum]|uniref:Protein kinase n=1 Tax=Uabimicrobium amorphum TaxID=2596890 RepID=A0A5S9F211_UABAM|nr:bifunctional serine/threonine protein kinase/MFS transporter [Candidatus Uabimicrobium amorphum]BBM81969.1 protein kinase [Candidatus Uabimicrobium amorphum]
MDNSKDKIWKDLFANEEKMGNKALSYSFRAQEESIPEIQLDLPKSSIGGKKIEEFTVVGAQQDVPFAAAQTMNLHDDEEVKQHEKSVSGRYRKLESNLNEDFILDEVIGEGGMGSIFKGMQRSLGRDVAIKILHNGSEHANLFASEARITGGLEHSNIVPIHHFGATENGVPHLAMKLVKGKSWLEILEDEKRPLKEHLRILITVCNAIAYAHENKIIHRDLKLENIMVGEFGEIFVMDWGLAVSFADKKEPHILHNSEVEFPAGTPIYMAPELATGEGKKQGPTTDVYLLGACLHHVLMKSARHTGQSLREVLENATASQPFSYPKEIPRELANICNKATAQDPQNRYSSVKEFQKLIEEYLEHEQANLLINEGLAKLEELDKSVARFARASERERETLEREIHRLDGEIVFALEQALKIWKNAEEARNGLTKENTLMLNYALETEDLKFAQYLMSRCEVPEYQDKIRKLQQKLKAQKDELIHLREAVRAHDWQEVASPLGTIFLFAAILGALGCFLTGSVLRKPDFSYWMVVPIWLFIPVVLGGITYYQARGLKIRSLVSQDIIGMWVIVGITCMLTGVINHSLGLPPFRMIGVASLLIGIGIANMALDIKKWLFIPAAVFFLGGVIMGVLYDYGLEIFGFLWLTSLMSIGVYFKIRSFVLEEDEGLVDIQGAHRGVSGSVMTFALLFFGYFAYYLTRANMSVAQLSIVDTTALTTKDLTAITSWGIMFYAIGKFTNGMIADKIGGKSIFILGMIGSVYSTCMFATGETYAWFLGWWCCNFYFLSMGWSGLIKICSHWYGGHKQRGTIMGIMSFSYQMGEAVAKAVTTLLASFSLLIWQGLFFVPAALLAIAALIVFLFLKEQPSNRPAVCETPNIKKVLQTLFTSRAFLLMIWGGFALTMVRGFFQSYSPQLLADRGLVNEEAGYVSTLFPIAGMVGTFLAGWISDKMNGNRGPVLVVPCMILAFMMFGSGLFFHSLFLLQGFLIISGFLIYAAYSVLGGVAAIDVGGNQAPSTTAGVLDGFGYLGYAVGSFLMLYFNPEQMFTVFAVVMLLMSLTLIPLWKIYPTKPLDFTEA